MFSGARVDSCASRTEVAHPFTGAVPGGGSVQLYVHSRVILSDRRPEGKPKMLVLNNIANKLLRVLCGMINNRQPYIEDHMSVHPRLQTVGTRS